ncbi:MAG TPA: cysteine peptidase family C39 domain-containing protein [Pirellulales bacterium]
MVNLIDAFMKSLAALWAVCAACQLAGERPRASLKLADKSNMAYPVRDGEWRNVVRCGPNALYMFAKLRGWTGQLSDVYRVTPVSRRGCSLLQLKRSADSLGVPSECAKATPESLATAQMPVITHHDDQTSPNGGIGHFYLVTGFRPPNADGRAQLHCIDPSSLVERVIPINEFSRSWSGYVLIGAVPAARGRATWYLFVATVFATALVGGWIWRASRPATCLYSSNPNRSDPEGRQP